jgi:transcriptional regulator with XRE-family HTH domain
MGAGDIIRQARLAEGLTQAHLARRLGITQPAIARLEHAGDAVTVATLQRALDVMGRTLELTPAEPHERFESWYDDMRQIAGVAQHARAEAAEIHA